MREMESNFKILTKEKRQNKAILSRLSGIINVKPPKPKTDVLLTILIEKETGEAMSGIHSTLGYLNPFGKYLLKSFFGYLNLIQVIVIPASCEICLHAYPQYII